MRNSSYTRVCIVNTVYSLFLYFLISSESEINTTFFFLSDGIPPEIRKQLPHYYFKEKKWSNFKYLRCIFLLFFKYTTLLRWPFLKKAAIFGHDHLSISSAVIGNRDITLLEDGIANYSLHPYPKKISWFNKLQNGGFSEGRFGYNKNTRNILLTGLLPLSFSDPRIKFIQPTELWNKAHPQKQKQILRYFCCNPEDISIFNNKDIIVFTQPFSEEGMISEAEKIHIYQTIIKNYPPKKTIIKTHPRENSKAYQSYFPEFALYDKKIPIELLSMLGIKFKIAATVNSSAALGLNYPLRIDWYGSEINKSLLKVMGPTPLPEKFVPPTNNTTIYP